MSYLLLIAGSLIYFLPFMKLLLQRTDEGTLVYGAVRVAQGQVPFRDFFEVMGPGTFYWLAFYFKIFGISWFTTRISLAVTSVATVALIYHLARRLQTEYDLVVPTLFVGTSFGLLWPTISHHGDSNLCALVSFAVLLAWIDRRRAWILFIAGLGAGITTCFLQPKGVLLAVSFSMVVWISARKGQGVLRSLSYLYSGYGVVGLVISMVFWARNGFSGLIHDTVLWPLTRYSGVNSIPYGTGLYVYYWQRWTSGLASQFGTFLANAAGDILIVPHLLIAALPLSLAALAIYRRQAAFSQLTIPYWIVGSALWLSELHRKDIMHLVYGSPILIILFFYLCKEVRSRLSDWGLHLVAASVISLASFNFLIAQTAQIKTATPRGVVTSFYRDGAIDYLIAHTQPGDALYAYPYGPMYYFLTGTNNPTRFSFLLYDMNTDLQFEESIRDLEHSQVRYVVWDSTLENTSVKWAFPSGWEFRQDHQIMEPYLTSHYAITYNEGGVRVMERKSSLTTAEALRSINRNTPQAVSPCPCEHRVLTSNR